MKTVKKALSIAFIVTFGLGSYSNALANDADKQKIAESAQQASKKLDDILNNPAKYNNIRVGPVADIKAAMDELYKRSDVDKKTVLDFAEKVGELLSDFIVKVLPEDVYLSDLVLEDGSFITKADLHKLLSIVEKDPSDLRYKVEITFIYLNIRNDILAMEKAAMTSRLHSNKRVSTVISELLPSIADKLTNILIKVQEAENNNNEISTVLRDFDLDVVKGRIDQLSDEFVNMKRFMFAIGLNFDYTPELRLRSTTNVDTSPFEPSTLQNQGRFITRTDLDNKSYQSLSVHAKMEYFTINIAFPSLSETITTQHPVFQIEDTSISGELLSQSTSTVEIDFQYDVSISVSLPDVVEGLTGHDYFYGEGTRSYDGGLLAGMIGVQSKETIQHDLRVRNESMGAYTDLPSFQMLEVSQERDYLIGYVGAYLDFAPTDNIQLGINVKTYLDDDDQQYEFEANSYSIGLYARWYPTMANDWF